MTVRKNFVFDEEIARHLEELAKKEGKTQTQITQEAIEKLYKDLKTTKKLDALKKLKKTPSANVGKIDIQKIRIEKALKNAK